MHAAWHVGNQWYYYCHILIESIIYDDNDKCYTNIYRYTVCTIVVREVYHSQFWQNFVITDSTTVIFPDFTELM